jgi:hypothetical protein
VFDIDPWHTSFVRLNAGLESFRSSYLNQVMALHYAGTFRDLQLMHESAKSENIQYFPTPIDVLSQLERGSGGPSVCMYGTYDSQITEFPQNTGR